MENGGGKGEEKGEGEGGGRKDGKSSYPTPDNPVSATTCMHNVNC